MPTDDLARFCCQSPACRLYGARGAGNLSVCGPFGKQKHIRLLYCSACKARFPERKGTASFRSGLAPELALSVLRHLAEGNGIRQTERPAPASTATPSCGWRAWPGSMPTTPTTKSWPFPPETREVQLDEKWSFVAKKQARCDPGDPADDHKGDWWDHVAYDAEHRLILAAVSKACGGIEDAGGSKATSGVYGRRGVADVLLTSDEYPAYEPAIGHVYGEPEPPKPPGTPGRRPVLPPRHTRSGLTYATVHKEREKGRVVAITLAVVLGTWQAVRRASRASRGVNTSFVERHHLTDRHHNARKSRRTYRFSKDWRMHEAMTYFTMYSYNFCWPVRTLRERDGDAPWRKRTPAMAAGLADHVWSLKEWLTLPAVQQL